MSFPRYESYKDSGVEWLGDVPEHWDVFHGRRVFTNRREVASDSDEQLAASQKYGVIPQTLMMELNDSKVMLALKGTESFRHVEKNDFVISLRSFEGGIEHSNYIGCVSPAYTVLKALKVVEPNFFRYLFKSKTYVSALQSTTDSLRDGKSITYQQFGDIQLVLPSVFEQQTIAAFLDRETAKIDTLIAEQQRLIELLKEKRQSVISHAVTKGLNPNAPMKDSGIEWLGEVPEHWGLPKLKHFTSFAGGGTPSRDNLEYWNGDIPWVSPKDMKVEIINSAEEYITQTGLENSSSSLRPSGQVLMVVRSGILKHTIPVAITEVPVALNQDMKALSFTDGSCLNLFFMRWTQGLNALLLLAWAKQGATVESIEHTYLTETVIPLPPISEQQTIVAFLDRETTKLDTLTTEAKTAITLLQERRTALISAAVTGKIDVRGLVFLA